MYKQYIRVPLKIYPDFEQAFSLIKNIIQMYKY